MTATSRHESAPTPVVTSMTGRVVTWNDADSWDRFVNQASDGTVAHRWAWKHVVAETYGHKVFPLAVTRDGALTGVLPLVLVRGPLFGSHLVSMPYLDCGGVCCNGDEAAQSALVGAALALAEAVGVPLELRHLDDRSIGLPAALHKVTMALDLDGGEDAVWRRIKSNRRGQVRKARKNGLSTEVCGREGVDDFYTVLATNMRDLGSPAHRKSFYANMLSRFDDDARLVLVRRGPQVVGAGLVLFHGNRAVLPWSSSLRSAFSLGPNQLLYWEAIRCALERGSGVFDFGRSSPASGTFEAKREWGAEPVQLHWHRSLGEALGAEQEAERMAWAGRLWRHLPVSLATRIGSLVRGGLPQ